MKEGELIAVTIEQLAVAAPRAEAAAPGEVSFEVVYADDDVIVVNKPAGLVTHPGAGVHATTLVGGLLERYPELAGLPAEGCGSPERPGIVHRLDKETSGLLVVARSPRAYRALDRAVGGADGQAHVPRPGPRFVADRRGESSMLPSADPRGIPRRWRSPTPAGRRGRPTRC